MTETQPIESPVLEIKPLRTSPEIDKIAGALAKAQGMAKHPKKNKTAVVPLKTGGSYSYNYSDLADVLDSLREPFASNGIAIVQVPYVDRSNAEFTCIGVVTRLMHESGQWIEGELAMPVSDAKPQSIGSVITYGRRYMLAPMGGIASDDDDDGSAAQGNAGQTSQRSKTAARLVPAAMASEQQTKIAAAKEAAPVMTAAELHELDVAIGDFNDTYAVFVEKGGDVKQTLKLTQLEIIKLPIGRIRAATQIMKQRLKEAGA